ncbi:MAG: redoxin family protein [Crocinitomicaceae bacterium]|nr:redoxin family protein [Crocinitomicaceae bacterium]
MKQLLGTLLIAVGLAFSSQAQLPNGSIAPDFTLTDLDGNTHHLYDYLNQGKVVFIEFFACHCPSCWAYHQTGTLDDLNLSYGPTGTDQVVVLMLEYDDPNSLNEFYGIQGWTQGDWVTGNSVPMVDVVGEDRVIFDEYQMVYFTTIYKICPDKTTELMSTGLSAEQLYQSADACPGALGIEEETFEGNLYVNYTNSQLVLEGFEDVKDIRILNSMGQEIPVTALTSESIDLSGFSEGIYFVHVEHSRGTFVRRVWVR